ncbi:rod shape-determining protein MreC [Streptomonospora wellingtoniae]|uniref:Cell shape-determining protein MreC n=1 Tax=Streptomonospora wellingtoniae TaxID=3075544 RepID=A0ABU2KPX8_9ACTN|nr:rod shape-determining protein MreC [Streptomonospora sp. DSM 45055]MDT0301198.1 rod shape-determining protein MreC [Streptomonospora sp. DSM 45055]
MRHDGSRARLVVGILAALSLVLVVLDSREGANPVTSAARTVGEVAFRPVSAGVSVAGAPIGGVYRTAAAAFGAAERAEDLEQENEALRARLQTREYDSERAAQLDELLHLSGMGGYEIVPAQAVTRVTARGFSDTVTLDVGRDQGVRRNMTVVSGDGLVGRIVRAGAGTSTVVLVTDHASSVGARLEDSHEIGVADGGSEGSGDGDPLRFELMSADTRLKTGQRIVTLGSLEGTPYVPGVPVGTITSVDKTPGRLTRTGRAEPAVDFGSLDVVGVIVAGPEDDPRDSLLPDPPSEAPGDEGDKKNKKDEQDQRDGDEAADGGSGSGEEDGR